MRGIRLSVLLLSVGTLTYAGGAMMAYVNMPPAVYFSDAQDIIDLFKNKGKYRTTEIVQPLDMRALFEEADIKSAVKSKPNDLNLMALRYDPGARIVDMKGKILHTWHLPFSQAFPAPTHVESADPDSNIYFEKVHAFPNGDLLGTYTAMGKTPYGYGMVKMDKNSKILWTLAEKTHHDFWIDPDNGHIFALVQSVSTPPEFLKDTANPQILVDHIVEISPDGKKLSSFSILDAFMQSSYRDLLIGIYDRGVDWDPMHTNSVERLPPELSSAFPDWPVGSFLISMRSRNILAVLDPSGKTVLWAASSIWKNQHAAHFMKDGTILLLDNRGLVANNQEFSRILSIHPRTMAIQTLYSDIKMPFYTGVYGRAQRLENGNVFITETLSRRVLEVDAKGNIAWQMTLPKVIQTRFPDIAMPKPKELRDRTVVDTTASQPNLATAIVFAERLSADTLPFLKKSVK